MSEKPPLGLMARWRWMELRLEDIRDSMVRYSEAKKDAPWHWVTEEKSLVAEIAAELGNPPETRPSEEDMVSKPADFYHWSPRSIDAAFARIEKLEAVEGRIKALEEWRTLTSRQVVELLDASGKETPVEDMVSDPEYDPDDVAFPSKPTGAAEAMANSINIMNGHEPDVGSAENNPFPQAPAANLPGLEGVVLSVLTKRVVSLEADAAHLQSAHLDLFKEMRERTQSLCKRLTSLETAVAKRDAKIEAVSQTAAQNDSNIRAQAETIKGAHRKIEGLDAKLEGKPTNFEVMEVTFADTASPSVRCDNCESWTEDRDTAGEAILRGTCVNTKRGRKLTSCHFACIAFKKSETPVEDKLVRLGRELCADFLAADSSSSLDDQVKGLLKALQGDIDELQKKKEPPVEAIRRCEICTYWQKYDKQPPPFDMGICVKAGNGVRECPCHHGCAAFKRKASDA